MPAARDLALLKLLQGNLSQPLRHGWNDCGDYFCLIFLDPSTGPSAIPFPAAVGERAVPSGCTGPKRGESLRARRIRGVLILAGLSWSRSCCRLSLAPNTAMPGV